MKSNNSKSIKKFQERIAIALAQHYSDAISENAKRAWKLRKKGLSAKKIAM